MGRRYSHYGRKSVRKVEGERERAVFPLTVCEYRDWRYKFAPCSKYAILEDPTFNPYAEGDVVYVRVDMDTVTVARVIGCKAEPHYDNRDQNGKRELDYYIPKFKVQFLTKDGYWSGLWKYVWPGSIYRAYYDSTTDEPVFRPDFLLPDFLDALK